LTGKRNAGIYNRQKRGDTMPTINLLPLGDQAVLTYCADETQALAFASAVRLNNPPWLIDVVQAYTSVAVFFDLARTDYLSVKDYLNRHHQFGAESGEPSAVTEPVLHTIPCCYEFQLDLIRVAEKTSLAPEEVIRLHHQTEYTIYAIGFCPGFPYLGYLPPALCNVPRLEKPRLEVEPGSVGLTGRQTGIYTEARPGGWNLVGRTPLELVHVEDDYFPLCTGDRVKFKRIDEAEFQRLLGERLPAKQ
jgi:inhibitor of KinA